MNVNARHKDSVFSALFSNPDALRELYSAIEGIAHSLELTVQVYNINHGHNMDILKKCGILNSYSAFVEKIREYENSLPREKAMKQAIEYCISNNILKQFLEKHSSEVFNMLLTEWDTEEAKEVWYEEGREERAMEIARNALGKGIPLDTIREITDLDLETIKNIQAGL